jgi:hypothetical protein
MKLFELGDKGIHAVPAPELMMVREFHTLLTRTDDRDLILRELAYVYHMADVNSPYNSFETTLREERIIEQIMPKGWKPDPAVWAAVKRYKDLKMGPLARLLDSSLAAIHKVKAFLDRVDFDAIEGEEGKPVYGSKDVREIMAMLGNLGKTVEGIGQLREQVEAEQVSGSRTMKGIEVDPTFTD